MRLEEVEATAASYGRKMIAKLEEKVRMLENELGSSQMRCSETHKAAVRADRTIKELQFTSEEDQKNFEKLSELVEKLQGKTRTYKKQIEDAEEIAALNLAKFRKAQQQLEEAEDRSQAAETHSWLLEFVQSEPSEMPRDKKRGKGGRYSFQKH